MAKNTATKRREVEAQNEEELAAARALVESERAGNFVRAIIMGALFSALALWSARWGAQQLWGPAQLTGKLNLGCLIASGLIGGAVAGVAGRAAPAPLPAGACALGWGLMSTAQHLGASGKFAEFTGKIFTSGRESQNELLGILASNNIYHPLYVIAGLFAASLAGWAGGKFFYPTADRDSESPRVAIIAFPILLTILGFLALWALSLLPYRALPTLYVQDVPAKIAPAIMCGVIAMATFGIAAYNAAKYFSRKNGMFSYLAGPLAVLVIGLLLTRVNFPPFRPLFSLIIYSSPFEMACWGAFGAVAGFWVRELNRD